MSNGVSEDAVRAAVGEVDEFESLGGGGQGLVWRVKRGNEEEAVKVLRDIDPERADREVEALQAVDSPHVMKFRGTLSVIDGSETHAAIRGEFIPGGTIEARLRQGEWPDELQALQTTLGVLKALNALHAANRVHRDIKPANVALREGRWDEAVVLDLGLVRDLVATSITRYPELLGTVPFMAPEQLRQERAVQRTDIFAAGVLLFLLLTRELPYYDASTDVALPGDQIRRKMIERAEGNEWPRWSRVQGHLDGDVAELLAGFLDPEAYARPKVGAAIAQLQRTIDQRTP